MKTHLNTFHYHNNGSLNLVAKLIFRNNRLDYTDGKYPPISLAEQDEAKAHNRATLENLYQQRDLVKALSEAERLLWAAKTLFGLYCDTSDFPAGNIIYQDALNCLADYPIIAKSLTDTRKYFAPFADLVDLMELYQTFIPEKRPHKLPCTHSARITAINICN